MSSIQATISIAKVLAYHDRTKHMKICRHFIKKKFRKKYSHWSYIHTTLKKMGIFTKALPRTNFEDLISKLGIIKMHNLV